MNKTIRFVLIFLAMTAVSFFIASCTSDQKAPTNVPVSSEENVSGVNLVPDTIGNVDVKGQQIETALAVGQYNSFPWGFNLPFRGCWYMTCGYGCYKHVGKYYYSTDWANGTCTSDVLAPGAGWVMWVGDRNDGFGKTVLLECGPTGMSDGSRYIIQLSHLSRIDVVPGWWLPQGYRVGIVGNTGTSTGCHIHWAVYRGLYNGNGTVSGSSFPPSYSTGVDGFNGGGGQWCSDFR